MLIDLHAHTLVPAVLDLDEFWGPSMTGAGLRVGNWLLKTNQPWVTGDNDETRRLYVERTSITSRLAKMDAKYTDRLVLSTPAHTFMYWAGDFGTSFAQATNDGLAEYAAQAPDRLSFWGHANLADPAAAVKEIRRAVEELGAVGLSMGGPVFGDLRIDDPALYPVWETLIELDVIAFVHGYNSSVAWSEDAGEDDYETTSIVGMNSDETLVFWYLVNSGVLDRYPDLKIYITHGGGMVPYQLHRFSTTNRTMVTDKKNQRPLHDYLADSWFDLDIHSAAMRRAVVADIGADHMLYGTNFGGLDSHDDDLTEGIGLDDEQLAKIRFGNAIELLHL